MPAPVTLAQIASRLGGRVVGEAGTLIRQVGSLERAGPDQITFFTHPRYKAKLASTRAGAVVLAAEAESLTGLPRIVCDNPHAYFARLSQYFNSSVAPPPGVHPSAQVAGSARIPASARIEAGVVIGDGVTLGARAWIGPGCVIEAGAAIGDDSRLYALVVINRDCRIGARAILHSGVVIGADGFGIAPDGGQWVKVPQIGRVVIGDDVEIGANTTIDRGAMDDTIVEDGVKLDNQIQIGHNCRIGAHTAMAGFSGVAGSTDIGRHCAIGAAAVVLGHLEIVDHVNVSAGTVVSRSIRKAGTYTGMFPFDEHASWARNTALVRHLSDLARRLRELEKKVLKGKENG